MNELPKDGIDVAGKGPPREHARSRIIISAVLFFLAGAALSAVWFSRSAAPVAAPAQLSDATKAVLQHLDSPVEIRFYSILDASSVQDSVQAFAGRADQLLAQYEQAAGGRVRVIRFNTLSQSNANAASADGVKAFNIDKGDSCFLGVAVVCDGQKESLSHLAPEWEQALEPDLTRAIARAAEGKPGAQALARPDAATVDAVKRTIPNVDAVSLEEGTKALRNAGLAQFMQAAQEMEAQVKDAREQFLRAQGDQSEAAAEKLRKIQKESMDKLQQIALNSHAQIAALQQLKKASP
jgi:ElaB/YqjD/DUF883 family membrane-anchored ribosome-binding protein